VFALSLCAEEVLPTLKFPVDETPDKEAVPAADDVEEQPVPEPEPSGTLGAAVAHGVAYLRGIAHKDEDKWIVPPIRHRKLTGHKDVEVQVPQYKKEPVTVDVPVYELITVEEYRDVKVGQSADAVKVRKKVKVKKRKKVGTRKETRHRRVVDPDAPRITKTVKRPVYGPGGPDGWNAYAFGHNALAAFALMQAGTGADDEVVERIAFNLRDIYEGYGLPDLTWDLAWSTALFSMIEEDKYREMARQMAGKLLDGQIAEGKGSGLWGPVCVNPDLLATMVTKKDEYSRFYLAAKQESEAKKRDSYEKAMNQALDALRSFARLMTRVTMTGTQFGRVDTVVTLKEEMGLYHPLQIAGYPQYPYNQTSADIGSTAVALFALRVASEHELLPEETWRPKVDRGRHLLRPQRTRDILSRTLTAIARNQDQDGSWSEMNVLQPVRAFDKFEAIEGVPPDLRSFVDLASPTTRTSTAQAYSVLSSLAKIYDVRYLTTYARNVVAGNGVVREALEEPIGDAKGGLVAPYEYCFALLDPPDLGNPECVIDAWPDVSDFLVRDQNEDGSWGPRKPPIDIFIPSSFRERMAALPARVEKRKRTGVERSAAHVWYKLDDPHGKQVLLNRYGFNPRITATAHALLYLASDPVMAEPGPDE